MSGPGGWITDPSTGKLIAWEEIFGGSQRKDPIEDHLLPVHRLPRHELVALCNDSHGSPDTLRSLIASSGLLDPSRCASDTAEDQETGTSDPLEPPEMCCAYQDHIEKQRAPLDETKALRRPPAFASLNQYADRFPVYESRSSTPMTETTGVCAILGRSIF